MNEFDDLVAVVDELLGENGCPWDQKQTMKTIRSDVLEEVSELIEAIDLEDNAHIEEELGDLFFNVIFLSRLAEKEKRTEMKKALIGIKEKLIRRHPHVFEDEVIESSDHLLMRWNEIKLTEKGKEKRTSVLDGIPKSLPALARAQKVLKKMEMAQFEEAKFEPLNISFETEDDLSLILLQIVSIAKDKGMEVEHALKKSLNDLEIKFRKFEASNKS